MNRNLIFGIIVCIILITMFTCYATNNTDVTIINDISMKSIDSKLNNAIHESENIIWSLIPKNNESFGSNSALNSSTFTLNNINLELEKKFAIKRYGLKQGNNLSEIIRNKKFADLISDEFCCEVPIVDDEQNVIAVASYFYIKTIEEIQNSNLEFPDDESETAYKSLAERRGGTWILGMINNIVAPNDFKMISNTNELISNLKTKGYSPLNIKYVSLGKYNTNIIYFESNNVEYGIPYSNSSIIGLENGTVYEISTIINQLECVW